MIALDTSVLARYVLNDSPTEALAAEQLIATNSCSVSWSVLVELCWVLEANGRLTRSEVVCSLTAIADSERMTVPDAELLIWAIERYENGADFPDMIHLVSALSGATEFASFDRKLARQAGPQTPLAIRTLRG
jgi:predicted nucleic-acid-binding protein